MRANTGRPDLDALVDYRGLREGEPTFIIRAGDELSGDAARAYAGLAHAKGCSPALIQSALLQADELDAWPHKKLPDLKLSPHAEKRLTYELSRRDWARGLGAAPPAQLRGRQQLVDQLLAELFSFGAWDGDVFVYRPPAGVHRTDPLTALGLLALRQHAEAAVARRVDPPETAAAE